MLPARWQPPWRIQRIRGHIIEVFQQILLIFDQFSPILREIFHQKVLGRVYSSTHVDLAKYNNLNHIRHMTIWMDERTHGPTDKRSTFQWSLTICIAWAKISFSITKFCWSEQTIVHAWKVAQPSSTQFGAMIQPVGSPSHYVLTFNPPGWPVIIPPSKADWKRLMHSYVCICSTWHPAANKNYNYTMIDICLPYAEITKCQNKSSTSSWTGETLSRTKL